MTRPVHVITVTAVVMALRALEWKKEHETELGAEWERREVLFMVLGPVGLTIVVGAVWWLMRNW